MKSNSIFGKTAKYRELSPLEAAKRKRDALAANAAWHKRARAAIAQADAAIAQARAHAAKKLDRAASLRSTRNDTPIRQYGEKRGQR